MNNTMVNVWVYNNMLPSFLNGECEGYLYPLEPRYQAQLLLNIHDLEYSEETDNKCRLKKWRTTEKELRTKSERKKQE